MSRLLLQLSHMVAIDRPQTPTKHNVSASQREFEFKNLKPVTTYNVTVTGIGYDNRGEQRQVW